MSSSNGSLRCLGGSYVLRIGWDSNPDPRQGMHASFIINVQTFKLVNVLTWFAESAVCAYRGRRQSVPRSFHTGAEGGLITRAPLKAPAFHKGFPLFSFSLNCDPDWEIGWPDRAWNEMPLAGENNLSAKGISFV